MTTFKKYMAAKTKVNEQQVPKTMNQNYFIRKEINEYDGEASTSGGEIDAAIAGALAVMGRALKNGLTYAKLKSLKGPYLEQYRLCGSSSSRTVFDEEEQGKALDAIKDREIEIKNKKESVDEEFQKKKDSLPDGMSQEVKSKKTTAIDKQKEIVLAKIEMEEQKLKTAKQKVKDNADNKWDQEKRKLDAMADKISNAEGGFVLGGSFKAKWDSEFKEAKLDIDKEVTEKAREIATARDDKNAVKDLNNKLAKLKEKSIKADEEATDAELGEDEQAAADAMSQVPSLTSYEQAKSDLDGFCTELDKAYRPEAEKEKQTEESESVEEASSEAPKAPSPSDVIAIMGKAYSNQPDESKPDFASKIISNIEKIRDLKVKIAETRLKTSEEVEKVASDEKSKLPSALKKAFLQDGKVPDNFKENAKEAANSYQEEIDSWKEKAGKETKGKEEPKGEESEEKGEDTKDDASSSDIDTQIDKLEKEKKALSDEAENSEIGKKHKELSDKRETLRDQLKTVAKEKGEDSEEYKKAKEEHDKVYDELEKVGKEWSEKGEKAFKEKEDKINNKIAELKQRKEDENKKEESVSTDIPKKFMKFEDYLNMKEKNK